MLRRHHRPAVLSWTLLAGIGVLPGTALWGQAPQANLPESLKPNLAIVRMTWGKSSSFVFAGRAGETITLRVNRKSPGLDPLVCLFDPENRIEAFDDDSGGRGNSLIKDHVLKQNGQYTVVVGLENKVQGKVEIRLESASSSNRNPAPGPAMAAASSQLLCEASSQNPQ